MAKKNNTVQPSKKGKKIVPAKKEVKKRKMELKKGKKEEVEKS